MRTYIVMHVSGHEISVEADGVEFGPGHVIFWNGDREELVRALQTDAVAEVVEEQVP